METPFVQQFEMLRAVSRILDEHAGELTPEIEAIHESLRAHIAEVARLYSDQSAFDGDRSSGGRRRRALALRDEMLKLARNARRLFDDIPQVHPALRVPHKRAGIEAILDAARVMCDVLEPHAEFLRGAKVDVGRLERIRRHADDVRAFSQRVEAAESRRHVATKGIPNAIKLAMRDKRSLDSLIGELPNFPTSLWESAARTRKPLGRPKRRRRRNGRNDGFDEPTGDQPSA